jgi:3-isopropylmalate/(R)-2-methylmalate dehydratase small subunit
MIVEGKTFPIDRANIDTDQIIPTRFLAEVDAADLGAYCFNGLPGIDELYAARPDATIVVARENFGAGSSREHAVWALASRGFRAVVAPSFARIFEENAYNNAFLLAAIPAATLERVFGSESLRIDVPGERIVLADGESIAFTLDPLRKAFLLGGGFLPYMASQIETVRAWETSRQR